MKTSREFINKVMSVSRYVLVVSLVAVFVCILISYPYADQFGIPVQISAHILTIVFAGTFKVSVVALMAAGKELKVAT